MKNEEHKENYTENSENISKNENKNRNKALKIILIVLIAIFVGIVLSAGLYAYFRVHGNDKKSKSNKEYKSEYKMSSNSLEDFDLYFLKTENNESNEIYSPLSIKYALAMLKDGAEGDTKAQIDSVIGDYQSKKYVNSANMSLANAMFIKESKKDLIIQDYTKKIQDNYNAEIIYDAFQTPENVNNWVSNKTFNLINNLVDDVSDIDYILVNALAIDMEWVNKIQSYDKDWNIHYPHEDYYAGVSALCSEGYQKLNFGVNQGVTSVKAGASVNKYDILTEIGEDKIREEVGRAYEEWYKTNKEMVKKNNCESDFPADTNAYLDKYISEISTGYGQISNSTDFEFYQDNDLNIFAKDLKEYDGTTLQYIGIMPRNISLKEYINSSNAQTINDSIGKLKPIDLSSFNDGVVTRLYAYIPMFKFEYELDLMSDLQLLGITDVFDKEKADLSKLTTQKGYIQKAKHKANIDFSNDGIKAGAATYMAGKGAGSFGFEYFYEVPIEEIEISFDKPYMFIIRDKETQEVWFVGTVYNPTDYATDPIASEKNMF